MRLEGPIGIAADSAVPLRPDDLRVVPDSFVPTIRKLGEAHGGDGKGDRFAFKAAAGSFFPHLIAAEASFSPPVQATQVGSPSLLYS